LAYLCDIVAKMDKLNISMQGPDKNKLDASDYIAIFVKTLSLWKGDITNMSGSSQFFNFI